MANRTYLQIVQGVALRLRENNTFSTLTDNINVKLYARFVNDAKREIEDAYNWNCLKGTVTATTVIGQGSYVLTGAGERSKILEVLNDTSDNYLKQISTTQMTKYYLTGTPQNGQPMYFNINGVDSNNDPIVDVYPIPDAAYDLRFNMILPQADLSQTTDVPNVADHLVEYGAYVKALEERGDASFERAEARYNAMVATAVSQDARRNPGDDDWVAV